MKKLGGCFFEKTRIDEKTKGENLEVSRKMCTFADRYKSNLKSTSKSQELQHAKQISL